jgi:hypothetical protein
VEELSVVAWRVAVRSGRGVCEWALESGMGVRVSRAVCVILAASLQ